MVSLDVCGLSLTLNMRPRNKKFILLIINTIMSQIRHVPRSQNMMKYYKKKCVKAINKKN